MRARFTRLGGHRRIAVPLGFALLCALLAAPPAAAQVLYGSIVGNVSDATGATVPGATVMIVGNERQFTRYTLTDLAGSYTFATIQTGTYTLRVRLPGFRTFTRSDVPVTLNTVTRIDVGLRVGEVTETVKVTAEAPVLQTDRAEVRAEFNNRELRDLPIPVGRNYQRLFKVLPGFTPPDDALSIPSNPSRALVFNVNGASRSSNNTRIDGVSTTNIWLPHVTAYVPALESLDTVNVVTNTFDAEQGLAGGSAINVQIKSGTNTLHGAAFEYHTNETLREGGFFAPPGTTKGKWRYHQYGGTLGGPFVRDRLFYFVSYEGTRDHQTVSDILSVPTEPLRRGDLSASPTPIYDPTTGNPTTGAGRAPFPGNIIPANRIDPIVQKMLPFIPLPNLCNPDGTCPELNNYFLQAPFIFNRWTVDSKVNWNASERLNLFGRYSVLDFCQNNETVFGQQLQGNPIFGPSNPGIGGGKTHSISIIGAYTLTPTLVLDAHFGFVRMNTGVAQSDIDERKGLDWLGIPGTNGPRPFEGGMPWFDLSSYTDYGTPQAVMPYYRKDDQYQNVLNINWLKGSHNVRLGTDIYFQALNHTQPELPGSFGARGGFVFGTGPTQVSGGPSGNNFNSWATFLLGLPTRLGRLAEIVAPYTTRNRQYSFYARDQWQVGSKLTVSYGTRWEYFPIPTRADRGLERYNPETNQMEIGGVGSVPMDLGVEVSRTLFAPRLGVAYRATPTLVFRGGFGITNDPYSLARPMRTNHPVVISLNVQAPTSFAWAGRLRDGIPSIPEPDLGNGVIDVPGNVGVVTLPDKFERGYLQSWNLTVQKELKGGFVGEAAYVGTRQVNQLGQRELNWSPIGGGRAGRQLFQRFGRDADTVLIAPIGDSQYNSLQARLERRFANGLQVAVNYTLSRSVGIAGAANSDQSPRVIIPEFYHLNHALSDFDRTHNLEITNIAELPFGKGRRWLNEGGFFAAVLGGWQVNNLLSFYSGTPFNVTASGTSLNSPGNLQMADRVTDVVKILGGVGPGTPYFDPLAFRPVTEARFGNAGYNVLRGPGYANWDLGVFRQFQFGDRADLQIRAEAFNVTNTGHFNNPGANVSNLQLNPDGSVRDLNGFAEITGAYGERQVRLGIRLGF
jgi:hypothetical protein